MIQLHNISVTYGSGKTALRAVSNASLRIKRGEVFGIVGASGAGKSSLLRTINLLERPTAGRVEIGGRDITDYQGAKLREVRLGIGMIFQHFNLIHTKTIYQNVAFALKIAGKPKPEIEARVTELLALVGLSDKRDAYPSQLSGGQKQRVGIARALANRPQILLCDEPTSALDLETTKSILKLLKDINQKLGITVVLITHEMDVVKRICDRVAVIDQGRIVELGATYQIFAEPEHPVTQELVRNTLNLDLPSGVAETHGGTLVQVVFRGKEAVEPVFSQTARLFGVNINLLHGLIEYIGGQPLGIFIISIKGKPELVADAILHIRHKTEQPEEAANVH